jgi:hypothetical protein
MPPKVARWNKQATNELEKLFNLFTESSCEEGWDPRNSDTTYVKSVVKDNNVLKPFWPAT